MRRYSAFIIIIIGLVFLPQMANSHAWLKDRDKKEGPGFKLGDSLVLHLGMGLEGGYDSNALYSDDPVRAGRLRITPYLDIATRSPQRKESGESSIQLIPPKVIFRFGFAAFYDRYFSGDHQTIDRFNKKFNPFGINTNLNFTVLPERKVSLLGGIDYTKTMEPYDTRSDAQSRHQVAPNIGLRFRPGGGTLSIEPKYRFNFLYFSDDVIAQNSNRLSHDVSLLTNWKMLPKTALLSNLIFSPTRYYNDNSDNVDSNSIRSYLGLQSLLLNKFGMKALGGYGAGFYESGPDFEGFIGDFALMFFITPFTKASLGAKRDFVDSFFANYFIRTGGYLSFEQMIAARFLITLEGSIYNRNYAENQINSTAFDTAGNPVTTTGSTDDRNDVWITSSLLLEYRASDWLSFHMSGKIMADVTDFSYNTTYVDEFGDAQNINIPAEFFRLEIFAGVRFHY